MPLLTITAGGTPPDGKKVIWLMFRQHAWETGSSWAGEGAIRFLLSGGDEAAKMRREAIFKIFPMADPQGVRSGNVRFNQAGFDLNRNWDVDDAVKMPEIAAQKRAILKWVDSGGRIDLFLTLHNTETSEYLEGPPAGFDDLGPRFFAALERLGTFAPTRPFFRSATTTTAGKPGRMNASQGLYHLRRLPAFTMEQMIARNPKLGRFPTIDDRIAFGAQLARAAFAAVVF
jgi:Zinc carboxypeptidase